MTFIKGKWWLGAILLVLLGVLTAFKFESYKAPQYQSEAVHQGNIQNVVQATGNITAVTTVQVGSQVSGTIQSLNADFNSHVKKGQVIAQMDPSLFQGALLQAKADLADARANVIAAKANLEKAQAAETQTHLDFDRYQELAKDGVIPAQQLDSARAAWQSAVASLSAAKAAVNQAAAQEQQKSAAVTVAQTNLDHSTIRSPIDGTVVARSVDVGQTVAASLQAPTLFTIAQDLTKMQVYVSTDESDVGSIHAGQTVSFKVDAFPNETFTGQIAQVRLNPTTVQNVVTYTTVANFDNPRMKLFPGMTAYVSIPVASAENVLEVPNPALRFTPHAGNKVSAATLSNGSQRHAKDSTVATVWKMDGSKSLQPVKVKLGITDHRFTEVAQVLQGTLHPGDRVVTGDGAATQHMSGNIAGAPGMGPGMRMGR